MLSDKMREVLRLKHYSLRTEEAYLGWVRRFVRFHGGRHPRELAENEVRAFLTPLAAVDNVAAATQNQAVNALVFLYRAVLEKPLGDFSQMLRARAVRRRPVIFTRAELARVFEGLTGTHRLFAELLYGTGMRLTEGLRLRVKDVEFQITVPCGTTPFLGMMTMPSRMK